MQARTKPKTKKKHSSLKIIAVRSKGNNKTQGLLRAENSVFRCAIGRNGVSALKREGDKKTPIASMRILSGFRKAGLVKPPASRLKMHLIKANDGWCDSSDDANYNQMVKIPYRARVETMQRRDHLYDIGLIIDWNIHERKKHRGSAIFIHLARPGYPPTEGCIALCRKDMERLLPHLSRQTRVQVIS